ncbi:tumor protein p53-inducible protein 11-like isoform X2 [Centruroides sculpturatus]|uniref:tumor protein p53-inducible protein 11-like isoform X2 n=1 Tax=Centruroides sculpturatus TaxID=218467 RepID=UPI000C6CB548|nr:tumor protein p53-inducible protein 11-like isoform X2 [Centruroides sculpturatus]
MPENPFYGKEAINSSASTPTKHSSGDLHSRLKTRKILGVGETDNGDIHRSKISQLLGHNEHLYVKFPRGYWVWHITAAAVFTSAGVATFLFPDQWYNFPVREVADDSQTKALTRYFGSAVLAVAVLLWSFWGTMDKHVVRSLLAAVTLLHFLILLACSIGMWQREEAEPVDILVVAECLVAATSSLYFYWAITFCNVRMRKSASHKELRETMSRLNSSDGSAAQNKSN